MSNLLNKIEPISYLLDDNGNPIQKVVNVAMAEQTSHDSLCANANIQIGDIDVSAANPVPTTGTSTIDQTTDGTTNRVVAKISQVAGENVVKDTTLEALIGEVQASPTENTLLARIKALETALAGTLNTTLSGSNLKEATTVNVLVAGTRVQLPDLVCSQVMIIAKRGNTGYIYVGGDDVSATVYGADLGELDCVVLPVSNTNEIYIDASVSGEGISYVAI